jgi:photosystem II stability/assembly factor-like uncharacterized protein
MQRIDPKARVAKVRALKGVVYLGLAVAATSLPADAGTQEAPQDVGPQAVPPSFFADLEYRMVGPTRGGRVTAVEGHRGHPGTFYMGATGGGVWKTYDYGQHWRNISDTYFASPSIGSIEVADSDTSIVYVGTGSDGIRSNVIIGRGLYKSTDAGETWAFLGLRDAGQIGAVKAHPENPDLVYAAALGNPFRRNEERGVFRSRDGGVSWERVLFTSDSVGAVDLELHPANPSTIYAAMWRAERKPWTIISGARDEDGIWKSNDGGDSWRRITNGLPAGLIGKVDFTVSPTDPDRVYALVEAPVPGQGLYRSDDAGESWRLVNDDPERRLMHRPFYFTNITADPTDADVVYVNNLRFWKSTDGGETFESIRTPHGDNHDLWINPDDPRIMVQSNDGGANVTRDGGSTWSSILNQPTAELYQVDVDDRLPYWLYAGQQDNSTIAVPSLPPAEPAPAGATAWWKAIGGCETGPAVPKPGDPDIVYANCKGRFGVFNLRTGQEQQYYVGAVNLYGTNPKDLPYRFQRVVPIEVSPHDANVVYHGSQFVHVTRDGGRNWETISPDLTAFPPDQQMPSGMPINRDITGEEHYSTLYVIEASPHEPEVIWAGANDGPVHVTRDGGRSWADVTPPMPSLGRVNAIEISPHDPAKVYVAAYRYLLGDFEPYLFRTTDYGESWTRLTDGENGIPNDYPTRVVREDPERASLLYAGTDFGVFISFDDGMTWQSFQQNLPVTPITDLEVVRQDLVVSTMGRSFWVLDDLSPLHQLEVAPPIDGSANASADTATRLFKPRDAYRLRYRSAGGYSATGTADPSYPSPGAYIHYHLARTPEAGASLEILDAAGLVVRRDEGVPMEPGLHRIRWNLRYPGPWSPGEEPGEEGDVAGYGMVVEGDLDAGRGPVAAPTDFRVRLTVDGVSREQPLQLHIDPRVEAEGVTAADLDAQLDLALQVRDALSEARRAAAAVDSMLTGLDSIPAAERVEGASVLRAELEELQAVLTDAETAYPQPMLVSQLEYLYGMLNQADQPPGSDAYARYGALRDELDEILSRLGALQ